MGLISRVSSRTYRLVPDTKKEIKMKLSYAVALSMLLATSYVVKAQEDAEDVDAEVLDEDEDDVEIEDDDGDVMEEAAPEPEAQPQLMPMPLPGVKSFLYFPDGAMTISGGKASDVVVGVQNNGDIDIEMVSVNGRMTYPQNNNEVVQNFTNVGYDKQIVTSKSEASFYYAFMPNIYAGGRDFNIAIEVFYKEKDNMNYYRALPFNQTVSVLESAEGVATEIFFMYSTVFILAIVGGFFFYQKVMVKKLGFGKVSGDKKKVETGTSNEGVNMDWIY